MDLLKKYIYLLLIICIIVGLIIGFRSFLMTYIIEPVALLFWAVWRIFSSVDQDIYWIALIIVCSFLVIRLIPSGNVKLTSLEENSTYKPLNRAESWQILIDDATLGRKESEYLRDNLKDLYVTVFHEGKQVDSTNSADPNSQSESNLSPATQQYLYTERNTDGIIAIGHTRNLIFLLPRQLRSWAKTYLFKENELMDEILGLMETELEIDNEQ